MSWYGNGYGNFAPYVPVATKIARGHAAAKKLATKEGRSPAPVKIDGRKIAKTFWGTKWCEHLERFRDYANRLPRGATYVRNGSVADLVIEPGCVRAIVGGSEAYTVKIQIKTLLPAVWKAIGNDCASEIESLFDLLQGRFSDGVMTRLTRVEDGLFPRPNEITMSCTCPDGVGVCKHIAATFYGVGSRLDVRPELLFTLRKVDHRELIGHAASTANLNESLSTSEGVALSDGDLMDIFGIEMESPTRDTSAKKKPSKAKVKKTPAAKASAPIVSSPSADETKQAVTTPAVKKRPATKKVVVAEPKKPSPRRSPSSTQIASRSKASPATSARVAKAKVSIQSAAVKKTTTTVKPGTARKKLPVQSPARQLARARRTK